MGADILGGVMRNRTYSDSRMLGHVTCTHIQALLHTNQHIVLYNPTEKSLQSIKFPGCYNKSPEIFNIIVTTQIHFLLHPNFISSFLFHIDII